MYLVRLKRFELLTHGLEGRCSIQLSYKRRCLDTPPQKTSGAGDGNRTHAASLEGWNSTIELHPHLSHFRAVSTTPVYNSIIHKNCQIIFAPFFKKIKKISRKLVFCKNEHKNVNFLLNLEKIEKLRVFISLFRKKVL